jgi:addiction module RelE/StbE family toxin
LRRRWTEAAVHDLTQICDYVAERDGAAVARRIALKICDGLDSLAEFPRKGRTGRISGTRELVFAPLPWLAVYSIREDSVVINRILHGAKRFPD